MPFRPASLEGTKSLTCLYSESGGGKTLSALLLARGLAGPNGTIGMIDTENRRGEIYAKDPRIGGYSVLQLGEPFSPKNYIAAIEEAEAADIDVLVIDSMSHEWEGIGGVLDMAVERANGGQPKFGDWKVPKTEHKHLIQKLMRCKAHVIVCCRAQYKSRQIDKKDYAKYGITANANTTIIRDEYQSPIQEERFIFEMTVHLQMSNTAPGVPIITKCPDMLLGAFTPGEPITVQTGERMALFYNQGAPTSAANESLFSDARFEAESGTASYAAWFTALSPSQKRELVNAGEHEKNKVRAAREVSADGGQLPDTTPGGDRPYIPPSFD
jgi:hypothetical protein